MMGMPMSALIFAALAAAAAQPRPISDARIAAIDASPFDRRAMMFHREQLGLNRGMRVVADYPCSDVCPDATVRIIHYDRPPGRGCEAAGGVTAGRMTPVSIAVQRVDYCVPAVLERGRGRHG
jgi:hypothetical protein